MKKDMPLEGLRWSRDSGSALYDTPQTAVLGRAGGGRDKENSSPPETPINRGATGEKVKSEEINRD